MQNPTPISSLKTPETGTGITAPAARVSSEDLFGPGYLTPAAPTNRVSSEELFGQDYFTPSTPKYDGVGTASLKAIQSAPETMKAGVGGIGQALGDAYTKFAEDPFKRMTVFGLLDDLGVSEKLGIEFDTKLDTPLPGHDTAQQFSQDSAEYAAENRAAAQAIGPVTEPGSAAYYTSETIRGIANMVPAVAGTLITRNPGVGMAIIGGQVYGDTYSDSRARGLDQDDSERRALVFGAAEAITEAIPLGSLLKPLASGGKHLVTQHLKRIVETAVGESVSEGLTQAIQMGYDAGILDETMTVSEALRQIGDSMIIGGLMGGGIATSTAPFASVEQAGAGNKTPQPKDAGDDDDDTSTPRPVQSSVDGFEPMVSFDPDTNEEVSGYFNQATGEFIDEAEYQRRASVAPQEAEIVTSEALGLTGPEPRLALPAPAGPDGRRQSYGDGFTVAEGDPTGQILLPPPNTGEKGRMLDADGFTYEDTAASPSRKAGQNRQGTQFRPNVVDLKALMDDGRSIDEMLQSQPAETPPVVSEAVPAAPVVSNVDAAVPPPPSDQMEGAASNDGFVSARSGSQDFGQVDEAAANALGVPAGPIRLETGWDNPAARAKNRSDGRARENAMSDGVGLVHIEARHGKQIMDAMNMTVPEFVEYVAKNFNAVAQGHSGRTLIGVQNGRESVAVLELMPTEDGAYTVVTAGLRNKGWMAKQKLPWKRSDQNTSPAGRGSSDPGTQGSDTINSAIGEKINDGRQGNADSETIAPLTTLADYSSSRQAEGVIDQGAVESEYRVALLEALEFGKSVPASAIQTAPIKEAFAKRFKDLMGYPVEFLAEVDAGMAVTRGDKPPQTTVVDERAGEPDTTGDMFDAPAQKQSDAPKPDAGTKDSRFPGTTPRGKALTALTADQESFARDVDRALAGDFEGSRHVLSLGETPLVFNLLGVSRKRLVMPVGKPATILKDHPGMTADLIKRSPALLSDPIMVMRSAETSTNQAALVAMLNEVDANGDPIVAVVTPATGRVVLDRMNSIYGKDDSPQAFVDAAVQEGRVLYLNKRMARNFHGVSGVQFPRWAEVLGHGQKVLSEDALVKAREANPDKYRRATVPNEAGKALDSAVRKIAAKLAPQTGTTTAATMTDADGNPVSGSYTPALNLIQVALSGADPINTLHHESIHALRAMGLFSTGEWQALVRRARRNKDMIAKTKKLYPDLGREALIEEVVAQDFADLSTGKATAPRGFRKIIERITDFFQRLKDFTVRKGADYQDVFDAIRSGEIGARTATEAGGAQKFARTAFDTEAQGTTPHTAETITVDGIERTTRNSNGQPIAATKEGLENFWKWFGDSAVVDAEGKPLVVYHGTEKGGFDQFDEYSIGTNTSNATYGFYFTENRWNAETYSGSKAEIEIQENIGQFDEDGYEIELDEMRGVYPVYLAIKDPLITDFEGRSWDGADENGDYDGFQGMGDWENEAKQSGADGLIANNVTDEGRHGQGYGWGEKTLVAFDPTQIKSIHNRGTFDPTDARILHSRFNGSEPSEPTWSALSQDNQSTIKRIKESGFEALDRFRYVMQDRYIDLKRVQEAVAKARGGSGVSLDQDAYMAEELYHGRTGQRIQAFQSKTVEPIVDLIAEKGLSLDDVEAYLYARHAPERNARMAKINPEIGPSGSGMSDAEAKATMDRLSGSLPALKEVARKIDAINKATMQKRVEYGLLSQAEADAWQSAYEHYVPLRGFAELSEQDGGPKIGRGFDIRGKESKQALGRTTKATDILANILTAHEEAIVRGEKNKVGQAFLNLVKDNPNKELWEVEAVKPVRRLNRKTGMVETTKASNTIGDNVLAVKVDGEVKHITIHHRPLAAAMKNVGADTGSTIIRGLQTINRTLAFVNTSANPEFIVSNMIRDLQTAGVNLQQFDQKGLTKDVMKGVPKSLAAARSVIRDKGEHTWAKWYTEFAQEGGKTEFFGMDSVDQKRKRIQAMLSDINPSTLHKMAKPLMQLERMIQDYNAVVENGVRLSTYIQLRERGVGKKESASAAKNLTVNFNRRGSQGPFLGAFYLFFNASIQGSVIMMQALKHKKVQKVVAGIVVANAMLEIANSMISDEDDDGVKPYDKISSFTRTHNMIFAIGDDPVGMKVPLPYGYNVFAVLGKAIGRGIRAGMGDAPPDYSAMEDAAELMAVAVESFNPIGGETDIARTIFPTVLKPAYEIDTNENFMGNPIMPENNPYGAPKPDHERHFKSASEPSKVFTEWLFEATGGSQLNEYTVDISPETLDHLGAFMTGAAGSFVTRSFNAVRDTAAGDELEWNQVPFVRKVVEGENIYWRERRYFDIREAGQIALQELKGKTEDDRTAYVEQFGPELKAARLTTQADKTLRELRKQRRAVEASEALSDDVRKQRVEAITERMSAIYTRVLSQYSRLSQKAE